MFFKISILIANLTATKPSEGEENGGKVKTAKRRNLLSEWVKSRY